MRKRVLIVEDDALIGLDLTELMQAEGYDVVGLAGSVAKAIELLNQLGCDVAILDVNLGRETSTPIALELGRRGTPFIVLSGAPRADLPPELREAPFHAKPVRAKQLFESIRKL